MFPNEDENVNGAKMTDYNILLKSDLSEIGSEWGSGPSKP